MAIKKSALGRGLDALIDGGDDLRIRVGTINEIPIDKISTNPFQPRSKIDEEGLQDLASSIRELGIIQPISVRKADDNENYQLIAGERRYRAARIAGLTSVPAYIRSADDQGLIEMSLVENIQREDLDSIEIALGYQRLVDDYKLTQEVLSERVGKKRSTVTNYLRLLKLPAKIQLGIKDKLISMGHARTLINIEDPQMQLKIFQEMIKHNLSVRQVEELVRNFANTEVDKKKSKPRIKLAMEYNQLKEHLRKFFKTDIDLHRNKEGKGKIVIFFKSDEDLEKIIGILDKLESGE